MLVALRPGVLSVLRFGAFHRWIDPEDLTQETLHIVVERVRAATIDDPRKVFAFAAATARNLALNAARKMLRQQTVVDSELIDELAQNIEMEQSDLSESDDRHLAAGGRRAARRTTHRARPAAAHALLSRWH